MLKKVLVIFALLCVSTQVLFAQSEEGLVKWLTFKEAQEKNKTVPKPFLIDIYTDWCGWCKHMMRTTYSNENIAGYINTNYYPVKFNAETKDTIEYNGKIYKPLSPEPKTPHELAVKFLGNSLSYPSTIFVTNNFEYSLLSQGFVEDKKIEPLLIFILENAWKNSVYDEFGKHFQQTFYDTVFPKAPVKMYSVAEVEQLQKKKPRKILVNMGAEFCNTCKVMAKTTYLDSSVANYINKNFYLINFDATSNDTIILKKEKHYKVLANNFPINTLALKFSGNRFTFPALCLLDEEFNTIDVLNYYQSPEHVRPILAFIATNSYKTQKFNDFMQEYLKPPVQAKPQPKKK